MSTAVATANANRQTLAWPSVDADASDMERRRSEEISDVIRALLSTATARRASDILIERRKGLDGQQKVLCSMRVRGEVEDLAYLPSDVGHYVVHRFKIVAGLDYDPKQPVAGSFDLLWPGSDQSNILRLSMTTTGADDSFAVRIQYPD